MKILRGVSCGAISALAVATALLGVTPTANANTSDEQEVQAVVNDFLVALAERRLDELPAMFAPGANIGVFRLRDGVWTSSTKSFEEWYEPIRSVPAYEPYEEPVSEWSVRVEYGRMAFVRADALIIANGKTRSRNIDYFTLMKLDGQWRFLSASYVATPPADAEAMTGAAAVLAAEDAWIRAEIDGDEAVLRRVIDDQFTLNYSNGTTAGKEQLINTVTNWSMTDQEITERSVVVSGDTAVVFGTAELFFATDDGGERSSLLRYTTTWVRRGEQWRAIALHMSGRAQSE